MGEKKENPLLVVVPLDEAVALCDERLAVAALPLVLQEIGLLEKLLLMELELPHISTSRSNRGKAGSRKITAGRTTRTGKARFTWQRHKKWTKPI